MTGSPVSGRDPAVSVDTGPAVSATRALELVQDLVRQASDLHAAGRFHRSIGRAAIAPGADSPAKLPEPESRCVLGVAPNSTDWVPPELRALVPLELPSDLEAARNVLQTAGTTVDPRQIDVYQLGALLCRLLTGESPDAYVRSPRVKGKVPPELRGVLERALGSDGQARYADAAGLLAELNSVRLAEASATAVVESDSSPAVEHSLTTAEHDTSPSFVASAQQSAPDTSVGPGQSAAAPRTDNPVLPFTKLGHYEIVARIGQGGMGDVYKGYERALDRFVAIKVLPAELARSDDFVRRFRAEATAAAKLIHPNIIQIYYIGEESGHHFFAMQYVEGESLADLLSRKEKLSVDETLAIVEQALSGLAAAHKQGLVHRDVKPGNILLDREHRRALLADFGLVKLLEASATGHTATGVIMGTVDYISPEQGRGQTVDGRSDLYSFGVLLYRMLSGRLPFEADNPTALIFQHVYEQPPALSQIVPEIPAPLTRVIDRLMQKSPDHRHQTAEEVLADLSAFRTGRPLASDERPVSVSRQAGSGPTQRQTAIIQVPTFDLAPQLPDDLSEIRPWTWWDRTKDRAISLFRRHAPEVLQQLQNTQQQVDGAVAEYARRQRALQQLAREAEAVLVELRQQLNEHAAVAQRARDRAAQCSGAGASHSAEAEELDAMRAADALNGQVAEQQNQLDSIRLKLSQITATLETLQNQRDILRARLSAASAERFLTTGRPGPDSRTWATRLAAVVLIPLVTVVIIQQILKPPVSSRSERPEPAVVQSDNVPAEQTRIPIAKPADFEVERAAPLRQIAGHSQRIHAAAFSPDGMSLASASEDGTVRIWNPETAAVVQTLQAHAAGVVAVDFSPDGAQLVTGGRTSPQDPRAIKLWDSESGREIRTLEGRSQYLRKVMFSPDGNTVAAVYNDGDPISMWDVSQGQEVRSISPPVRPTEVTFHPDGKLLALGGGDVNVRLWDIVHNELVSVLKGHSAVVTSIVFSADGSSLFSGDISGVVLQWDIKSGKTIGPRIEQTGQIIALRLSSNGRRLAVVGREQASVWDLDVGAVRKILPWPRIQCAAYRPGSGMLVLGGDDPSLTLWDSRLQPLVLQKESAQIDLALPVDAAVAAFSAAPSQPKVYVGGEGFIGSSNYARPEPMVNLTASRELITALGAATYGYVMSGDKAGVIRLWDADNRRQLHEFNVYDGAPSYVSPGSDHPVRRICFASRGRSILIVTSWSMFLYDISNGQKVHLFKGVPKGLTTAEISPAGEFAATGGRNEEEQMGDLRLWNMQTGQLIRRFFGHDKTVSSVAFSPDGRILASGSGGVVVLSDVQTGEELRRLTYPSNATSSIIRSTIGSLAFSADGRHLISGGATISVWDVETGEELRRFGVLQPRSGDVIAVGGTHDGRQIISLHRDRMIRLWPAVEWPTTANN
jgi:WD40 repeat protein/serine/threonine protein kinase